MVCGYQELVSIKNNDLDLIHGFITVLGKGQKQRVVPISPLTRKEITKYIKYYRQRLYLGESTYLFPAANDERVLECTPLELDRGIRYS